MPTVKEIIDQLQRNHKPDDVIAAHIWSTEDVDILAEDYDIPSFFELSETDRKEVAENAIRDLNKYCDSEYGMTWIGLKFHVDEHLERIIKRKNVG